MRETKKPEKGVNRAVVQIFGEEYVIKGEADPEYMTMVAAYVDKTMRKIAERNSYLSLGKLGVLAALNLADELSQLQEEYDRLVKLIEEEKK